MQALLVAHLLAVTLAAPLKVGVIADNLVDYSTWASAHPSLWTGAAVSGILADEGLKPTLLTRKDLTLDGFRRFDAILISTDHTYPEIGPWGGPVSKALVAYVRGGGIYVEAIGVPHYISKDVNTGELDKGHWDDPFGFKPTTTAGRTPLSLTTQGRAIGLPDPSKVPDAPERTLNPERAAVLVWSSDYIPAMSAIPFGKGWLVHWGCGESMDRAVRDFLIRADARTIVAAHEGKLHAATRQGLMAAEGLAGKSLDDMDRKAFAPGPSPFAAPATEVKLTAATTAEERLAAAPSPSSPAARVLSLDGAWRMVGFPVGRGDARALITADGSAWRGAVTARVPCSVQTALFAAGKIPDPTVGFNDQIARREVADNEWWLRREFSWSSTGPARLVFDGVDYSATFWLNGRRLGSHEGPFGGPTYDVTGLLGAHNVLVVRLDPIPPDWHLVFKTNCVYGWHYVNCPPIGIWRSVRVEGVPPVEVSDAFVACADAPKGLVDLSVTLTGPPAGFSGELRGIVRPANFAGKAYAFSLPVRSAGPRYVRHLRFTVPDPHLWWPNDLGAQNLYRLSLAYVVGSRALSTRSTRFGLRTIRMAPLPGGATPDRYNWTFVINGRPTFVKGCDWCTLDAFLRLTPDRYRRFLDMAKDAHIQIMRSWGGGLLENDEFYNICDELGIMVWQEFPLTWQNFNVLRPAVVDQQACANIRRLRNHPSLALWCGGNENSGQGWVFELLGRRCLELDGTRPYHRSDPYGGDIHDYGVYWGLQPFEHNLDLNPPFIGEFGMASPCAVESTMKYLPPDERDVWPPPDNGTFVHHTPTFTPQNMTYLNHYAKEFSPCRTLATFTRASQLAQATGLRILLEKMRSRRPEASGVIYYKLTDVYPGCAWSTVDWYGVPKIAHYFVREAYRPLHVCALYDSLAAKPGGVLRARLVVLDDRKELTGPARVTARLYDAGLAKVAEKSFPVEGGPAYVKRVAEADLAVPAKEAVPLLLVVDLTSGQGGLIDRTYYWFNFRPKPGCLFDLPKTTLAARHEGGALVVKNTGALPAVGVHVVAPDCSDALRLGDGYFWLDPGETRRVPVSLTPTTEGKTKTPTAVAVAAWNAGATKVEW